MKMSYNRSISDKDSQTGRIDNKRFYAEIEIEVENLDKPAKLRKMQDAAIDLHYAGAIMLKEIFLRDTNEPQGR